MAGQDRALLVAVLLWCWCPQGYCPTAVPVPNQQLRTLQATVPPLAFSPPPPRRPPSLPLQRPPALLPPRSSGPPPPPPKPVAGTTPGGTEGSSGGGTDNTMVIAVSIGSAVALAIVAGSVAAYMTCGNDRRARERVQADVATYREKQEKRKPPPIRSMPSSLDRIAWRHESRQMAAAEAAAEAQEQGRARAGARPPTTTAASREDNIDDEFDKVLDGSTQERSSPAEVPPQSQKKKKSFKPKKLLAMFKRKGSDAATG
ncbi:hypothetical protein N2152v2_009764 [Parachlorella kessleri]